METAAGRPLEAFFDRWIGGSARPRLQCRWHVDGSELVVHVEQLGGVFEVPLPLTLQYADKTTAAVVVPVGERVVDARVRLAGPLRSVDADEDFTLADIALHRDR
jgi:hypothetical protein